jgi:hypothetical protein
MFAVLKFVAPKFGWKVYGTGLATIILRKLG